MFRDLAINPVAVALIRFLVGARDSRFSRHHAFIKWLGEYGYGPNLGMHGDQISSPLPWGRTRLTANMNWCLTEYAHERGAFGGVPASTTCGLTRQRLNNARSSRFADRSYAAAVDFDFTSASRCNLFLTVSTASRNSCVKIRCPFFSHQFVTASRSSISLNDG